MSADLEKLTARMAAEGIPGKVDLGMPVFLPAPEKLIRAVELLREEFGCDLLLDITAVDDPERVPRFTVVYHFLATAGCRRIRIKTEVPEEAPRVPTLVGFFGSARFLERETHDMYGIDFEGNEDLRPILLYRGFEGHPLRKDYPIDREQPLVEYRDPEN
jgi:NADH-quinone oxidoreductase subunit C